MDNYSKVISMKKEITPLKTPLRPQCFDFPNEVYWYRLSRHGFTYNSPTATIL